MPGSFRSALGVALATSLVVVAGCDLPPEARGCTLIGCVDAVNVELGDLVDEGFRASIESPVVNGDFTCAGPDAAEEGFTAPPASELSGDFAAQGPALVPWCTADGFTLARQRDDVEPPSSLTVEAQGLSSGSVVSRAFEDIEYDISQPNGPDCEPTCFNATLTVPGS